MDIIIQMPEHFIPNLVLIIDFRLFNRFAKERICVSAVPFEIQVERLVVDAGASIGDFLFFRSDPSRKHFRCELDTVAKARDLECCHFQKITA